MTPANRDTLREGMARAEIKAKFGPEAVDLVFDPPVAATDKQRTLFHARAEEARRHADQALTFLAPILDKADSAEAAEARANRLSAEAETDLEACAQHCEGYAALNAGEATARGKLLGHEKASRDEKCAALWATHHAANEMAGFIRDRINRRTALARAAVKAETEGSDHG